MASPARRAERQMNSARLVAYVLAVAAIAVAATAAVFYFAVAVPHVGVLCILITMALIAGARPVRLPGLSTELTATHPAALCALAALGPAPAVATSLAGLIGATVARRRPGSALRLAMNTATLLLAMAAAALIFVSLGGAPGKSVSELLGPLAAATTVYFVINTGLVAGAVALEQRKPFLGNWKAISWTAAACFAGFALAVGLLLILETLGPWGLTLGIPPTWLLVAFYRAHEQRLSEKQLRIDDVERVNVELQSTVDRLRDALAHVKQLQGLLPICMHCKRIRDDDATWHRLEAYISSHSEATFTHALCTECKEEHYPIGDS
jgi:hypothetical protein